MQQKPVQQGETYGFEHELEVRHLRYEARIKKIHREHLPVRIVVFSDDDPVEYGGRKFRMDMWSLEDAAEPHYGIDLFQTKQQALDYVAKHGLPVVK